MNILYVSPNYKPEIITNRYLHIDLKSNKPIVNETVKTEKTNYTYRSYELSENEYEKYSKPIAKVKEIMYMFPYEVSLEE